MNHSSKEIYDSYKGSRVYICSGNFEEFKEVIKSLEQEGYDVIIRADDENTIDRLYVALPDAILIDNDDSNNGITIFNAIKEEGPISMTPVVFTGNKNDNVKMEALILGALDYIQKPFLSAEIFVKLKNFVEMRKKCLTNNIYDMQTEVYSRNPGQEISKKYFKAERTNGTTFSVFLGRKSKSNILIIDEDPIILSILSSRYSNKGYNVLTSQNGEDALKIISSNKLELVITDIIVPGIAGYEIIKRIKQMNRGVRILVLSSQRGESHIDMAIKSGADEYVYKPFSPIELDLRVQRLIG